MPCAQRPHPHTVPPGQAGSSCSGKPGGSWESVASSHCSAQPLLEFLLQPEVWEMGGHLSAPGPTCCPQERPETPGTGRLVLAPDSATPTPLWSQTLFQALPTSTSGTVTAGLPWVCRAQYSQLASFPQQASVPLNNPLSLSGRALGERALLKVILSWPKPRPRRHSPGLLQAYLNNPQPRNRTWSRGSQGCSRPIRNTPPPGSPLVFQPGLCACVRTPSTWGPLRTLAQPLLSLEVVSEPGCGWV